MLAGLRTRRPSHATVVAYLALFVALGGTSAYATHELILSSDIVDGEVKTPDIANAAVVTDKLAQGAVTSGKVKNENLTGGDVADGSLTGSDVGDSTLGGADVQESTLGQVPSALVGGHGRYIGGQSCNPEFDVFITCAVVTLNVPAGGARAMVTGVGIVRHLPVGGGTGSCRVATSRGSIASSEMMPFAEFQTPITVVAITGPLGGGEIALAIECREPTVDGIDYFDVGVAGVLIAPN
jgi:hypothetical protein